MSSLNNSIGSSGSNSKSMSQNSAPNLIPILGLFQVALDDQGRIKLPKNVLDNFDGQVYIAQGPDVTLQIYPLSEFSKILPDIEKLSDADKVERQRKRNFFAGEILKLDKSGRLVIKPYFRESLKLEGEVILTGGGNKLELWNKNTYEQYSKKDLEG